MINNCLHYVKDVLRAGYIFDAKIKKVINNSDIIEPKGFILTFSYNYVIYYI